LQPQAAAVVQQVVSQQLFFFLQPPNSRSSRPLRCFLQHFCSQQAGSQQALLATQQLGSQPLLQQLSTTQQLGSQPLLQQALSATQQLGSQHEACSQQLFLQRFRLNTSFRPLNRSQPLRCLQHFCSHGLAQQAGSATQQLGSQPLSQQALSATQQLGSQQLLSATQQVGSQQLR